MARREGKTRDQDVQRLSHIPSPSPNILPMEIHLIVVGGTGRCVRCRVEINGEDTGELLVERANFTRLADLTLGTYSLKKYENITNSHTPRT